MSNIYDCTDSFYKLLNKEYKIILGRKGKTVELRLTFQKADCYHLIGLHYLKDRPDLKKDREIIFDLIHTREIPLSHFETSFFYSSIQGRIDVLAELESFLDSNDTIFKYSKNKTAFSKIEANYLMRNQSGNIVRFVFLSKRNDDVFCRSCFPKEHYEYSQGQEKWTLLYKEKINLGTGDVTIQYKYPSYKTPQEKTLESQNIIKRRNRDCR